MEPYIPTKPPHKVFLNSTSARAARREIQNRWPAYEVDLIGLDEDGTDVYLTTVRKLGDTAGVATARRNRSKRPIRFFAVGFR